MPLLGDSPTLVSIGSVEVGFVELDASVQETHSFSSEVTDHPVEDGSNVSDHVKQNPDELTIVGIVTNSPLIYGASFREPANRAESAFETLVLFKGLGSLVDVVTGLREYTSMVLTRVEAPRNARVGDGVEVTLHLRRVRVAKSQTSDKPTPSEPRGAATEAAGQKPPAPATPAQEVSALGLGLGA